MIKSPKIGQKVWFIEDYTLKPRQVLISHIWSDQRVVVDEERTFVVTNLYRSKQKAITAKILELDKDIDCINKQKLMLKKHLND